MASETGETILLNVQANNFSQLVGSSAPSEINIACNAIVDDISLYNAYLVSLTISTSDVPYVNVRRNILDFSNNAMNMTISLVDSDTTFDLTDVTNPLITGIGDNSGNLWQGVQVQIQYISENNSHGFAQPGDDDFISSQNYNRGYFNIHSLQQICDLVNTAFGYGLSLSTIFSGDYESVLNIQYDSTTQIFNLYMSDAIKNSNVGIFFNTFLERWFDGFRWNYLSDCNFSTPDYNGLNYEFNKINTNLNNQIPFPPDASGTYWVYPGEYNCIANIIDAHSVIVASNNGTMSTATQQILPINPNIQIISGSLPSQSVLKNIDIDFSSLSFSSLNNSYIQFESITLDKPLNFPGSTGTALTQISFSFYLQTIDNQLIPIQLPAGNGVANCKFALKRRNNEYLNYGDNKKNGGSMRR